MAPGHIRFGGGVSSTVLHPIVLAALIIAILLIFLLPRKYIVVPFLVISMLTPWGQTLVVAGVHLTVVRIVVLFAWVRLFWLKASSRLGSAGGLNSIDTAFSAWAFFYAFAFILLWWQMVATINRFGFLLDAFGIYFLFRFLIQDEDDIRRVVETFAIIATVIAVVMVSEQFTQRDIFGLLGGVSAYSGARDGLVRSHGAFQHAILAGTFGATMLPLFAGGLRIVKFRLILWIGILSAGVIVVTSSSSTPLLAVTAAIVALCVWPMRRQMRLIRWGIVCGLVLLQILMKADVWWLISHVNVAGGSSYHRAALVDTFIRHFSDWWLLGAKNYGKWGWDMWDVSNQFCAMGLNGGLGGFVAFIAMISRGFGKLGDARKDVDGDRKYEWWLWCVGCALFTHVVAFFGTGYWDQTEVAWFALLAMISAVSATAARREPARREESREVQMAESSGVKNVYHLPSQAQLRSDC